MLHDATTKENLEPITSQFPIPLAVDSAFEGFNFDDNATETGGSLFIPPDPSGAAGTNSLIAVVNVMIESRNKATGALSWRDSLQDFFSSVSPINTLFDPKIVFDHYENRFVVVALERNHAGANPNANNSSRILVAVSKTATPASATTSDWYYLSINSEESIGGFDHWADYPGFEIDEEAVYITTNMFAHTGGTTNFGVRLWIINKGVIGGFYGGGSASFTKHDPYAGAGTATTTMPAYIYGASGAGSGIGTYLVSYSGLTVTPNEFIQVVRIDDPLGTPDFTQAYILLGDIENNPLPEIPDAPQLGTATLIEVNDRRALDAVWRNDQLWLTTTLIPNSGVDSGQATAHWIKLNTSSWPPTLADQGDIGGEDIATGTSTFFPAVAVNNSGDAYFGFSASSSTTYAGFYSAGRKTGDTAGTVRSTEIVRAGDAYYIRTFGGTRNRWGDYSGASLDPVDDNIFWVYNTYAMSRGTPTTSPDEDGRWGTIWGKLSFPASEMDVHFPWSLFLPKNLHNILE